jgi:ribosomal protein L30/L7E
MIIVVRIAGRVKNKVKDNETLKRLKMGRKFACVLVDEKDDVRMGMVKSVSHMVAYGSVSEDFVKSMKGRLKDGVYSLHPPRGGFKRSSRLPTPKGILGEHEDIVKLVGRML